MKTLHVIPIAVIGPGETPPRVCLKSPLGVDMAVGPDEHGVWTIDQRRGRPRSKVGQAILEGCLDFWEREIEKAMFDTITTGTGMMQGGKNVPIDDIFIQPPRRCICCGAPETEVTHD